MTRIDQKVYETIAMVFAVDIGGLSSETQAEDVDGWDSLGHTTLLMLIERQFGIEIAEQDRDEIDNVGKLIAVINRLSK